MYQSKLTELFSKLVCFIYSVSQSLNQDAAFKLYTDAAHPPSLKMGIGETLRFSESSHLPLP